MKVKYLGIWLLICVAATAKAQDNTAAASEAQVAKDTVASMVQTDDPKGNAIVQVFANFHSGFGETSNDRSFELARSYFGYEYNFGNGLSAKAVMDVGKSSAVSDYERIAYIKNAMLQWKKGNLTLSGGLISTTQFNFQEKFWGHRYLAKSFQDEYKFGSSADVGVSVAYKIANWISADAIIVNGEGYKKVQVNSGLNYGLGLTLTPIKGLQMRFYGGLNESAAKFKTVANADGSTAEIQLKDIANLAAFIGYKHARFSLGAEYNHLWNASNADGADQYGYSLYALVNVSKLVEIIARFDDLYSKNDWNIVKDESAAILGAQFTLGKYVKLAPNFRMNIPKQDGAKIKYSAYLSCYFGI